MISGESRPYSLCRRQGDTVKKNLDSELSPVLGNELQKKLSKKSWILLEKLCILTVCVNFVAVEGRKTRVPKRLVNRDKDRGFEIAEERSVEEIQGLVRLEKRVRAGNMARAQG